MKLLTFIMPVRNVELFIKDAINGVQSQPFDNWELIIVDDNSTDKTRMLILEYSKSDNRIKVAKNPSNGKIKALNYGFSLSNGDYIKCIDGDDVLLPSFGEDIKYITSSETSYHNYEIVDSELRKICIMNMGYDFIHTDYCACFRYMKSLPRCTWTIRKNIADLIFPIPNSLPFEDVWFSLVIKKYAKTINYIKKPLYKYRQHGNQTYKGIFNFGKEATIFRSRRMLKVFDSIEKDGRSLTKDFENLNSLFDPLKIYHKLVTQEDSSFKSIVTSGLSTKEIVKLILLKKFSCIMPWVKQQWLSKVKKY